jgi:lipid-A-disaccharide synthase
MPYPASSTARARPQNEPAAKSPAPEILISAGETSGDLHAARLATALRERTGARLFGMGGERMREAGVELVADAREVSVVGLTEILHRLPQIWKVFRRLLREARRRRPALAILVDFPGFHMHLARELRARGVPNIYFITPQFWAWRPWRVRLIRRRFALALCIFPFEVEFFRKAGVNAEFIGHPLVGAVRASMNRDEFAARWGLDPARPIVALLPGSRPREVAHNLPVLLAGCAMMAKVARERNLQFVLAAAPGMGAADFDPLPAGLKVRVVENATYDALAAADVSIVSSGTATVEAALLGAPMVVVYRVSRTTAALVRPMLRTALFAMPNLIAGRRVVPELIQDDFTPEAVAREATHLLDDPAARAATKRDLAEIEARLHGPAGNAISRAAALIAEFLAAHATPGAKVQS